MSQQGGSLTVLIQGINTATNRLKASNALGHSHFKYRFSLSIWSFLLCNSPTGRVLGLLGDLFCCIAREQITLQLIVLKQNKTKYHFASQFLWVRNSVVTWLSGLTSCLSRSHASQWWHWVGSSPLEAWLELDNPVPNSYSWLGTSILSTKSFSQDGLRMA